MSGEPRWTEGEQVAYRGGRVESRAAAEPAGSRTDTGLPLDVERLARAIAKVSPTGTKYPERLAAEYAALASPATSQESKP